MFVHCARSARSYALLKTPYDAREVLTWNIGVQGGARSYGVGGSTSGPTGAANAKAAKVSCSFV